MKTIEDQTRIDGRPCIRFKEFNASQKEKNFIKIVNKGKDCFL